MAVTPLLRCRVGGGALTRWPPSAAQTARTVFPYAAFTKTPLTETRTKGKDQVDPLRVRQVDPGSQYPRTMMYGFFAKRTDPPHRLYSSGFPSRPACLRPPPSPTHFRRRSLGHAVLAAFQVLFSGPTTDRASLPTSLPLIGLLTRVFPRPCQSSWGHTLFFRPLPSANTLVRWVKENAFASIVQARPDPPWADRFIIGVAPIDYGPGLLLRPFGFHLAMDTLPSGVLPRSSTFFPLSLGQRGITPAFGYGAPHPGARGTSTLLNNVLLSTHYGRSDSCPPDSWTLRFNACSPCGQASLIHASGLPAIPSPNTCGRSASSGRGTLPHQRVGPRALPFGNSGLRRSLAGSPHLAGQIEFSFLPYRRDFLRTSR